MTLLSATALHISLGAGDVLADVSLTLRAGEIVGLIGPNGAGKTTLLRSLAGLLRPARGDIQLGGRSLASIGRQEVARTVAYLPQGEALHWAVTAETLVGLGRLPHTGLFHRLGPRDCAVIERAMVQCDVVQFRDVAVDRLSGGERSRVLLARALATEPRILLADEPIAELDLVHQLDVMKILRSLADTNGGVIVALHDLTLAARFCDRLVMLRGGRVEADGPPVDVLTPELLQRCYGVRVAQGEVEGLRVFMPLERTSG